MRMYKHQQTCCVEVPVSFSHRNWLYPGWPILQPSIRISLPRVAMTASNVLLLCRQTHQGGLAVRGFLPLLPCLLLLVVDAEHILFLPPLAGTRLHRPEAAQRLWQLLQPLTQHLLQVLCALPKEHDFSLPLLMLVRIKTLCAPQDRRSSSGLSFELSTTFGNFCRIQVQLLVVRWRQQVTNRVAPITTNPCTSKGCNLKVALGCNLPDGFTWPVQPLTTKTSSEKRS